jgi:hypothetical protein
MGLRRRREGAVGLATPAILAHLPRMLFWILFAIDAAVALVALYFFVVGLNDGSVSSFNIHLWMAMLGGIAAVLGLGLFLNAKGYRRHANGVLMILAVPGIFSALFLLAMIILQPRWN